MPRPADRFPVLARRDFRLLLADRLIAPGAFAFSLVGVSFAVLDAGGSAADLSYVLAAQIAPSLVFTLLGGVVADRVAPQRVIAAANLLIATGEGTFGLLVLTGRPLLWQMILLELVTGTGMAVFYPASQALLPVVAPGDLLQQGSAMSRLAMNAAQMAGSAVAGVVVAAIGPGWALAICGAGVTGTVPLLLSIRAGARERPAGSGLLADIREGWTEFRSHTWLWAIVGQYCIVIMAWYGAFQVLGPVVARARLGGPAAWGAITASESVGLVTGGLIAMHREPRRPMLFVAGVGATIAASPLSLAMLWPLPLICAASFGVGTLLEVMMVVWTVAMARNIPPGKLARVSGYDALGSYLATPAGALAAGPLAAVIGVRQAQYAAAGIMLAVSAVTLIPRDVRTMRSGQAAAGAVRAAGTVVDATTGPVPGAVPAPGPGSGPGPGPEP